LYKQVSEQSNSHYHILLSKWHAKVSSAIFALRHPTSGNVFSTAILQSEEGFILHRTACDVGEYAKGCSIPFSLVVWCSQHYDVVDGAREIRNKNDDANSWPDHRRYHCPLPISLRMCLGICAEQTNCWTIRSGFGGRSDANVTPFAVFVFGVLAPECRGAE